MKIIVGLKKILSRLQRKLILNLEFVNQQTYRKEYLKWLKKHGVVIHGTPNYISNTVYFDGSDFSMIELGDGCTISREVMLLTHDYSVHTVLAGLSDKIPESSYERLQVWDRQNKALIQRKIIIGDHSFVGARASLLPGTHIGNNCIVGAGAVVKGYVPDNTIVMGNPAVFYKSTSEWLADKSNKIKIQDEKE